jgi:hypothetical protein
MVCPPSLLHTDEFAFAFVVKATIPQGREEVSLQGTLFGIAYVMQGYSNRGIIENAWEWGQSAHNLVVLVYSFHMVFGKTLYGGRIHCTWALNRSMNCRMGGPSTVHDLVSFASFPVTYHHSSRPSTSGFISHLPIPRRRIHLIRSPTLFLILYRLLP